jgi:hypothetical protein
MQPSRAKAAREPARQLCLPLLLGGFGGIVGFVGTVGAVVAGVSAAGFVGPVSGEYSLLAVSYVVKHVPVDECMLTMLRDMDIVRC